MYLNGLLELVLQYLINVLLVKDNDKGFCCFVNFCFVVYFLFSFFVGVVEFK